MPLVVFEKKALGRLLIITGTLCIGLSMLVVENLNKRLLSTSFYSRVRDLIQNKPERTLVKIENIERKNHCEDIYVGCFALDLKEKNFVSDSNMTRYECIQNCSKRKLSWIGLTKGSICVCSSIINTMANPLKQGTCDLPCSGNGNENCGGNESIDVIQTLSHCFYGINTPDLFEENRFLGCFNESQGNLFGEVKFFLPSTSPIKLCILQCSMEHYPLAALDPNNTKCDCGWFTPRYNLSQQLPTCEKSSMRIYRTLSEDNRCSYPQFLPSNTSITRATFTSIQGSGNTWARHLIEKAAGIFSRTVYRDIPLAKAGFLGELVRDSYEGVFLIKFHAFDKNIAKKFKFRSVLFIVRNPYDAFIAEYNRENTGGNHLGILNEERFYSAGFSNFVGQISTRWKTLFLTVLNSELPYHVFFYENLLQDPIGETRKIIKFFEANNGFQLPNLEERLLCVQENLQGTQKRKTRKLSRDPYSKEMVVKINADIFFVRQFIASHNIPLVLPLYERN